jgi:hypothetical protein
VLFDHSGANRADHRRHVAATMLAINLMNNHKLLMPVFGDRERSALINGLVSLLGRSLNILRIEIATADDNQIFRPPRDEQLAIAEGPKVAGAKIRPATIREPSAKSLP